MPRKLLTISDLCEIQSCSKMELHRRRKEDPDFPQPVYLGTKSPRWLEDEHDRYLEKLAARRDRGRAA